MASNDRYDVKIVTKVYYITYSLCYFGGCKYFFFVRFIFNGCVVYYIHVYSMCRRCSSTRLLPIHSFTKIRLRQKCFMDVLPLDSSFHFMLKLRKTLHIYLHPTHTPINVVLFIIIIIIRILGFDLKCSFLFIFVLRAAFRYIFFIQMNECCHCRTGNGFTCLLLFSIFFSLFSLCIFGCCWSCCCCYCFFFLLFFCWH